MAEYKETVTTSQDTGVSENGGEVQQQTRQVETKVAGNSKSTAINIVRFIVGMILTLLALRFVLKLLGANPASGFVNFIYSVTNILTAPFDNIFGVTRAPAGEVNSVFEPSIIVAAIVYALIGWGITKLFNVNRPTA